MQPLIKKLGKEVSSICFTSLLALLFIIITYLFSYDKLPQKLPLFYSHPWGESELVYKPQFLILPITMILITIVNLFFYMHIHASQTVLRRVILGSTLFIDLLVFITAMKILFIFI